MLCVVCSYVSNIYSVDLCIPAFNVYSLQLQAATIDHKWFTPCVLMYAQRGVNSLFPEDALKGTVQLYAI